jgi:hypothetical protein
VRRDLSRLTSPQIVIDRSDEPIKETSLAVASAPRDRQTGSGKHRAMASDPTLAQRQMERQAAAAARDARAAERRAARRAEEARAAAERAAEEAAREEARQAALRAEAAAREAEAVERAARELALEAEKQAARDARYAARKERATLDNRSIGSLPAVGRLARAKIVELNADFGAAHSRWVASGLRRGIHRRPLAGSDDAF